MAMYPCRLRNAMSRPVEIHRGGEVLVLNPGAFLALETADPACERLERDGVLTRHAPESKPKRKPRAAAKTGAKRLASADRKTPARKPEAAARAKKVETARAPPASAERKTSARKAKAKRPKGIPGRKGASENDTGGSS